MKSLKEYLFENTNDDLDNKICENIKSELDGMGVKTFYVETREDEEDRYPQLYIATCDAKYVNLWNKIADSTEIVNIVENCGVEFVGIQEGLTYNSKKAFEIMFADTQAD